MGASGRVAACSHFLFAPQKKQEFAKYKFKHSVYLS